MSSRVLRKLQGDKDIVDDISDTETDIPVSGGARRKQLNINRYDLVYRFLKNVRLLENVLFIPAESAVTF
jgi:hypothetical protein